MLRLVDVKPDDVARLVREVGVRRELDSLATVRLKAKARQMRLIVDGA